MNIKKYNLQRKRRLEFKKDNKVKRKRIEMFNQRTKDSLKRKEWTKKHGGDT